MKKVLLFLGLMFIFGNAYADKIIIVKLTDEEYKAMSVLTSTPEEWTNNTVKNKAQKILNELVDKNSDKKIDKLTEAEKKSIINFIDINKEKESRNKKVND